MYTLRDESDEAEAERCKLRRDGELAKQAEIEQRKREELEDWENRDN